MRRSTALPCVALAALWAVAGCRKDALQKPDGAGGGIDSIDGAADATSREGGPPGDGGLGDRGGAIDGGGSLDSGWDVGFDGQRSFVVTSQVQIGDSGASHVFTMTLDSDRHSAIVGTNGSGQMVRVEQTSSGALRLVDPVSFGIAVSAPCGGAVRYDDLSFTIDDSGHLLGSGRGSVTTYGGPGATNMFGATMLLGGVLDTEAPTFALSAGGDLADPWTPLYFVSSEPLPAQQMRPVLRSASGDAVAFGTPTGMDVFVTVLARPLQMLRFGEAYRVTVDGITDLAGNLPAPTDLTFTTRPPPPLIVPDGFESVTDETLGGALVLSGAGAPVINGARSLYVPPVASLGPSGQATRFALRVPVERNAAVLRYAYRLVNPGDPAGVTLVIGSVGGAIATVTPPSEAAIVTTRATIDGAGVSLGQMVTTFFPLDVGSATEVVVALSATQASACGGPPPPPVGGMILDDIRTE